MMVATTTLSDLATEIQELHEKHELIFQDDYGTIYSFPEQKVLLCRLTKPYVPIDKFKHIFTKMEEVAQSSAFEKFIFDKRELQAFHQPSMEWYFIVWKKAMLEHGLTKHRKLMPTEVWFEQAVAAGRARIMEQYPDNVVDQLDIAYKHSLSDAFYE